MSREEKKQIFIQNNKNKKIPSYQNSSKIQSENHRPVGGLLAPDGITRPVVRASITGSIPLLVDY
jgi:hypothetical protein